jgi:hypothetical protein
MAFKRANTMGESFIISTYPVPQEVYGIWRRWFEAAGLNEDSQRLIKHVYYSARLQGRDSVPVPAKTIRRRLRKADLRRASIFVEISAHSIAEHRAREFSLMSWLRQEIAEAETGLGFAEIAAYPKVNVMTGRMMKRPANSALYDVDRHPYPQSIRDAIQVIERNGTPINYRAMQARLEMLEAAENDVARQHGKESAEYRQAYARFINDRSCYLVVRDRIVAINGATATYLPAYRMGEQTSRIYHEGGGMQSCSREMKAAAYAGNENIRNYDLVSSQVHAAVQFLQDAGIGTAPLEHYLECGKEYYAEKANVSPSMMKQVVLLRLMAATFPSNLSSLGKDSNSIMNLLVGEYGEDRGQIAAALESMRRVLAPMMHNIKVWHQLLAAQGVGIQRDACGRRRRFHKRMPSYQLVSQLAAFMLQGLETRFVAELTILGDKYGYYPVANEHDGLVTVGVIPQDAVEEASKLSGLRHARLIEKPFQEQQREL